jgi:hypothetical protein
MLQDVNKLVGLRIQAIKKKILIGVCTPFFKKSFIEGFYFFSSESLSKILSLNYGKGFE